MAIVISSGATRLYKRSLPVLFIAVGVGVLALGGVIGYIEPFPRRVWPVFIVLPSVFTFLGFLFKRLYGGLLDEVQDGGDHLVCKARGEEERVQLTNIMNVSVNTMTNPQLATLRLVKPSRFGDEISFLPIRESFKPFARNPTMDNLIVRVDQARARRVM